jgi:hypothetical protein
MVAFLSALTVMPKDQPGSSKGRGRSLCQSTQPFKGRVVEKKGDSPVGDSEHLFGLLSTSS